MPTLSVVVPAFNEEAMVEQCLDALAVQRRDILEVIVVDNGSTDRTAELVRRYREKWRAIVLVREDEPGVVHARNRGFDAANGSLIGRVDADTKVAANWAKSVLDFFGENPAYSAVTGPIYLYDSIWARPYRALLNRRHAREAHVQSVVAASGNNFAVRRDSWLHVREQVSLRTDVHEDIDLSLCLWESKLAIAKTLPMQVDVSSRRLLTPPREYRGYVSGVYRTYRLHGLHSAGLGRGLFVDWLMHALRWPITRVSSRGPKRMMPVDSCVEREMSWTTEMVETRNAG